jgi:hypothetical protein
MQLALPDTLTGQSGEDAEDTDILSRDVEEHVKLGPIVGHLC